MKWHYFYLEDDKTESLRDCYLPIFTKWKKRNVCLDFLIEKSRGFFAKISYLTITWWRLFDVIMRIINYLTTIFLLLHDVHMRFRDLHFHGIYWAVSLSNIATINNNVNIHYLGVKLFSKNFIYYLPNW